MIVLGQLPEAAWLTSVNDEVTSPQLSEAVPPAAVNWERVEYAAGRLPKQSTVVPAGQAIAGGVLSLTVNTCEQEETLPQESAIEYVLVIVLGQVPDAVWLTSVNEDVSSPQLSDAVPAAAVNCARVE